MALSAELLERVRFTGSQDVAALDRMADALRNFDPGTIGSDEGRIAFWVNVYNALVRHELARNPRDGSLLRQRRMFREAAYEIGGHSYSPDVIEHGLLRLNARPPLRLRGMLRTDDPRLDVAPRRLDPRVHFALNCAAASCPPIRSYTGTGLDQQLDLATRAYVGAETSINGNRITMPYLIRLYRADFGDRSERIEFVVRHLPEERADELQETIAAGARFGYGRYDWTIAN